MTTPFMFLSTTSFKDEGKFQFPSDYRQIVGAEYTRRTPNEEQSGFRFFVEYNSLTDEYTYASVIIDPDHTIVPVQTPTTEDATTFNTWFDALPVGCRITNATADDIANLTVLWFP